MFTYFTILENPSAIYFVLAMPSTMLLYFLLTLYGSSGFCMDLEFRIVVGESLNLKTHAEAEEGAMV